MRLPKGEPKGTRLAANAICPSLTLAQMARLRKKPTPFICHRQRASAFPKTLHNDKEGRCRPLFEFPRGAQHLLLIFRRGELCSPENKPSLTRGALVFYLIFRKKAASFPER